MQAADPQGEEDSAGLVSTDISGTWFPGCSADVDSFISASVFSDLVASHTVVGELSSDCSGDASISSAVPLVLKQSYCCDPYPSAKTFWDHFFFSFKFILFHMLRSDRLYVLIVKKAVHWTKRSLNINKILKTKQKHCNISHTCLPSSQDPCGTYRYLFCCCFHREYQFLAWKQYFSLSVYTALLCCLKYSFWPFSVFRQNIQHIVAEVQAEKN